MENRYILYGLHKENDIQQTLYEIAEFKRQGTNIHYHFTADDLKTHLIMLYSVSSPFYVGYADVDRYRSAIRANNIERVCEGIENDMSILDFNRPEDSACKKGYIHILNIIINNNSRYRVFPSMHATRDANMAGHRVIIDNLFERNVYDTRMGFSDVCNYNRMKLVEHVTMLLHKKLAQFPSMAYSYNITLAIDTAGKAGHDKIVQYLLDTFSNHTIDTTIIDINNWTTSAHITYQVICKSGYHHHLLLRVTTIALLDAGFPIQNMYATKCIQEKTLFSKRLKKILHRYNIRDWDNAHMLSIILQYISYSDTIGVGKLKLNKKQRLKLKRKYNKIGFINSHQAI